MITSASTAITTTMRRPTFAPESSGGGWVVDPAAISVTFADVVTETLVVTTGDGGPSVGVAVAVWVFVFVIVDVDVDVAVFVEVEVRVTVDVEDVAVSDVTGGAVGVDVADDDLEGRLGPAVGRAIDGLGRADTAEETAEPRPPPHDEAVMANTGNTTRPMRARERRREEEIGVHLLDAGYGNRKTRPFVRWREGRGTVAWLIR